MEAKWFFGMVGSKAEFQHYFETEYPYNTLISIHPLELREIAAEAVFFAKKLKVELPDYVKGMSVDPISFSREAIDLGIEPEYSRITILNQEQGTNYKNMVDYMRAIKKVMKPKQDPTVRGPLAVFASEKHEVVAADAITDEEQYLEAVTRG